VSTAEGLERNRETSHCAVEKLAHHYIQAGDYERGLTYAKQAAAEAERLFAWEGSFQRPDALLDELKTRKKKRGRTKRV
jgi:hypothetical protein